MKKIFISIIFIFIMTISLPFLFLNNNNKISENQVGKTNENINTNTNTNTNDNNKKKTNAVEVKVASEPVLPAMVSVYVTDDKKIETFDLEEYVKGVVASEMPANFDIEALKAQAVAARTLAVSNYIQNGGKNKLDDTVAYQAFSTKAKALKKWDVDLADSYWKKVSDAVDETKGMVLFYNDKIVQDIKYFATSSGKTESSLDVFGNDEPYLQSVESSGEEIAPKFKTTAQFKLEDFIKNINTYFGVHLNSNNIEKNISLLDRTGAGTVKKMKVGEKTITGVEFRKCLKLNSANFTLKFHNGTVYVDCIGYGHDVGMSQWGADVMGKNGSNYQQILKHYYKGIDIKKLN